MNFGEWVSDVFSGRRPDAALIVSGPQGSGKSIITNGLLRVAGLSIYEAHTRGDDLKHPAWSGSDVMVFREGADAQTAIDLVCNTHWAVGGRKTARSVPTPLAVIIETCRPELYTGRRFVHIRLGEDQ